MNETKEKLDQVIRKKCCNLLWDCNQKYTDEYAYPKCYSIIEFLHEIDCIDETEVKDKNLKEILNIYYNIINKLKLNPTFKTLDSEIKEMYFEGLNDIANVLDEWIICVLK